MSAPYVLVVDDHPVNCKLVTYTLEARGIATRSAKDAAEALAAVEREAPAVILMDVQLPGVDGLTLTRQLRADARFAQVPIVALTAYAMASDERAARDAGCDAFMSKPVDTRALGDLVVDLLARGGAS